MQEKNLNLIAISPVDGRYRKQTDELKDYFSESALIKYRLFVEVEYFIALCNLSLPQLKDIKNSDKGYCEEKLRDLFRYFTVEDAVRVKEIEKTTNHDVKSVEYFLKEKFDLLGLSEYKEFIHFGLTSQDINNTAIPYSLKISFEEVVQPLFINLVEELKKLATEWIDIPMLARTHGQPASPTTIGKELLVFVERIENQLEYFNTIPFSAKFGGATGNFNAHYITYPQFDWIEFADDFVENTLSLSRSKTTTQIEHYDNLAAFCDNMKRINNILIDLNRDIWTYISMNYFKQKINKNEVGSSTMPHKVNPIDFENSEGNLGIANALFEHLSSKLPISRLQRDLTDSTVTRNIGVPVAHSIISYKSLIKGLGKIILNKEVLIKDLEENWVVVAEAIQSILRRENYPRPYEALKELTRGNKTINQKVMNEFIDSLDLSDELKIELKEIKPFNYTGIYDLD